ncbi:MULTISPECIES: SRPBCC domain-containing protein [unclassified Streptomyces]|uniref:SRPBCC domain-containing protein n=1 Tax=unclassified Streptomyces TaxID=2593676 RepID=UPI002E35D3A0|nr:SRPBCC domain-containing protein [Streptomyces sp. NBC_01268]
MEHEVFVPVPAEVLRATLTDPARVARCVPGLQQDAEPDADPLAGRLKVRVGGNTITYRGALRISERNGAFAVEGEGGEVRGKGSAALDLTLTLTPVAEGTTLTFSGRVKAEGRLAETGPEARAAAAARLLDRFAEALVAVSDVEAEMAAELAAGADTDDDGVDDGVEEPSRTSAEDLDAARIAEDAVGAVDGTDPLAPLPPAAEAAHARRTMIGRSAEEVDHAPPRGRYAPVPAPETSSATATLRWIAPAAALAIASAVVVGRALRRRR